MSATRLLLELVRWAIGFALLWRLPSVGHAGDRRAASVVVPARNEAANLTRLLPSIVPDAPEVLVVDDGSDDATAEVARALGATVLHAPAAPSGWAGKPWACSVGAAAARHEILVFLDADVVVEQGGLARMVGEHARRGGLVSVQPWHAIERPYESLSLFPNLLAVMGVGAFTIVGERLRPRGAFGPCMVIDRATYDRAGGHASVKGEVAEDIALARRVARVRLFVGRGVIRYRMYPDGVASLVEGWVKNLATGARATHPVVLVATVAWVSGALQAPFTHGVLYLGFVAQVLWLARRIGRFGPVAAAVYPALLAFFLAVFAWSAVATFVRGRVTWRGRTIPTR